MGYPLQGDVYLLTDEGQEIISKPLGKIVDVKPFSSVSSMDVKVIVTLTVRLPDIVEIERENDLVDVIEVSYPWLPPLCPVNNEIGHKANFCPTRSPNIRNKIRLGPRKMIDLRKILRKRNIILKCGLRASRLLRNLSLKIKLSR